MPPLQARFAQAHGTTQAVQCFKNNNFSPLLHKGQRPKRPKIFKPVLHSQAVPCIHRLPRGACGLWPWMWLCLSLRHRLQRCFGP